MVAAIKPSEINRASAIADGRESSGSPKNAIHIEASRCFFLRGHDVMPGAVRWHVAYNIGLNSRASPLEQPSPLDKQGPLGINWVLRNHKSVLQKIIGVKPGRYRDRVRNVNGRYIDVVPIPVEASRTATLPINHARAIGRTWASIST